MGQRIRRRVLSVSPTDPSAGYSSISDALVEAAPGDAVVVGPGVYSAETTDERFPLYVPRGVSLLGSGARSCTIDGEGALETSWRPFRSDQSLVVLRDGTRLSGFAVTSSGGCGVSVGHDAACRVDRCNLSGHAMHALLISGGGEVVVRDNSFANNGIGGVEVQTYRPQPARPGENIFVVCTSGARNQVLIEGNDITGSSGQESVTVTTDPDEDQARALVRILNNKIRGARVALLLLASFGGSGNRVRVEVAGNEVSGASHGIVGGAAYPMVRRVARENRLELLVEDNRFRDVETGVHLMGAFSPAEDNVLEAELLHNSFADISKDALRVTTAVGHVNATVRGTELYCRAVQNTAVGVKRGAIVLEEVAMEAPSGVLLVDNRAFVQLYENDLSRSGAASGVSVRRGPRGNVLDVDHDDSMLVSESHDIRFWWD